MANDNTLGAPTEGLGQTVTFASGQRAGVPQATAMQRGSLRNSSTGGAAVRTAQALQVTAPKGDTLFQTLARLGGDLIKPQLEAERTLKYVEGWQRAANEQAIEEIVNEQPFFSRLFGASSVVDGARAYSAAAKATSMAVDFETNMGELRKLSPAEMSQYTASKIAEATQGGDATTNAMIVQQVISTLPAVMKGQTKAHIRYQQELRETATGDAYTASFALVGINAQEARKDGATKTVDDVVQAGIAAMTGMVRDSEIDPELHSKLVSQSAAKAIAAGNFPAYQVLVASGKLNELTADDQYRVRRAYNVASSEAKTKLPDSFRDLEFEFALLSTKGATPAEVRAKAHQINTEYKKLTGDPGEYFTPREIMSEQLQADAAERQRLAQLKRESEQADSLAEKEAKNKQWLVNSLARASNYTSQDSFLIDNTPKERTEIFDAARKVLGGDPAKHMTFIAHQANALIYDSKLESLHAAEIGTSIKAQSAVGIHKYYTEQYRPLVLASKGLGQVVAKHYAGQQANMMTRYHSLASQKDNPNELDLQFWLAYAQKVELPPVDTKRVTAIADMINRGRVMAAAGRAVGKDWVSAVNSKGLARLAARHMTGQEDDELEFEAFKRDNRDISVLGGYHWRTPAGSTRIDDWLRKDTLASGLTTGVAPNEVNRATRLTIDKAAAEVGIDNPPEVYQIVDTNGEPNLYIVGLADDGITTRQRNITAREIQNNWAASKKAAEWAKDDFRFGPKLTGVPNGPSIYATPAEWEAYRKAQLN